MMRTAPVLLPGRRSIRLHRIEVPPHLPIGLLIQQQQQQYLEMQGLGCRVASGRHFPNSSAARHLGCLRQQRSSPVHPRMEPAGMSGSAVPAGSPAAATAAAPHPLWQRIEERYNIAQREAAATMTDTNTGAEAGLG